MENINALKSFITDEQILELLIKYEDGSKMDACRMLQGYLFPKWQTTTLECIGIMQNIYKEFNPSIK